MSLLERSLFWLIPFVLFMLIMLHAMMEFTVSLLVQHPRARRKPISGNALRQRLLAVNETESAYSLVEGRDCDLEICWELKEVPQPGRLTIVKAASSGHLRLLLDEQRHELRMNQIIRSYYILLGLPGWLPRLGGYATFQSGPPGQTMTKEFSRITNRSGWSVRPVLWWFQATHRGYHLLELLTPAPFRRWSTRRFWGTLYPLSYMLGMGYLMVIIGQEAWTLHNMLVLIAISAAWWGIWGFLAWTLAGFPAFWRRRKR